MKSENSIQESLEIIRRALKEDNSDNDNKAPSKILILNQKVNNDGTIKVLKKPEDINNEINDIIDQKLNQIFEKKIEKILDEKIPIILKNYFDSK
tara:strand:+ start:318 stop:602 length:285 start_codon:yes stop_codon:yes gene_type:complete